MYRSNLLLILSPVVLSGLACVPRSHGGQDSEALTTARIIIHPGQRIGRISPYIYGASMEWVENGNRIFDPSAGRLRPDVIALLKPLRIPILRFPGGILADYYHWRDGIGARESRPRRQNPMDESVYENAFGTDEFIELCRALGSEALITANFGTGTLQETLAWQQYFAQRGFPAKYWEIGNEIYLAENRRPAPIRGNDSRIYKTPSEYASGFREWARALRTSDPIVEVGAIAGTYNTSSANRSWLNVLLSEAGPDIDFIALHNSFAPLILGHYDFADKDKRQEAYLAMLAQPLAAAQDVREVQQKSLTARNPPPKIAITEHFPLFGGGGGHEQMLAILDQSRTLAAALYTASLFHTYMRQHVSIATYNLVVSKWFGALITDTDSGLIRTPTYHVFDLYRNHMVGDLVFAQINGPQYSTGHIGSVKARSDVLYVDAVACLDPSGNLDLAVINRNLSQPLNVIVEAEGVNAVAEVTTLTGPSANAVNGPSLSATTRPGAPDQVVPTRSSWRAPAGGEYTLPPASLTIFKWPGITARSGLDRGSPKSGRKTEEL